MGAVKNADTLESCQKAATIHPDSKFFFWSRNDNVLGKTTSNCYVFSSCSDTKTTGLTFPGNTYQRRNQGSTGRLLNTGSGASCADPSCASCGNGM